MMKHYHLKVIIIYSCNPLRMSTVNKCISQAGEPILFLAVQHYILTCSIFRKNYKIEERLESKSVSVKGV